MSEPRWLDAGEMPVWLAFVEAGHLLDREIERQLKRDVGLSHAQFEILARLEAGGGRVRMSLLAEQVVVSRSGLSYQVARLERDGLVERIPCPDDERGVDAVLTPAGRAMLRAAAPGHVALARAQLIDMFTPAELAALGAALRRIRDGLRAIPPDTDPRRVAERSGQVE